MQLIHDTDIGVVWVESSNNADTTKLDGYRFRALHPLGEIKPTSHHSSSGCFTHPQNTTHA